MGDPFSPTFNGTRKKKNQTRIAHISDLHFTSTTKYEKEDVWKALTGDLQDKDADLLVVTGDIIDSSVRDNFSKDGITNAFETAKQFLLALCKELDIEPTSRLVVVPGNHDYRLKGVVSPHSKFRFLEKLKQMVVAPHFDLFYQSFKDYSDARFLPGLRCCLFTFDSNTTDLGLNLASGRITNEHLTSFVNLCKKWSAENAAEWRRCSKIALVHHHPMPIAETELKISFIESEGFHLLRNAGLFMTEMVNQRVDLILHGHKHYPALSQARFPSHDATAHTVSIIAAGSASTHGHPHTSYNLVTIFDDGGISVERRVREIASYSVGKSYPELLPYEQTRRVLFNRLAGAVKVRVKKYTRIDSIKPGSGDDEMVEKYRGVTTVSGSPELYLGSHFASDSGFVSKPTLESPTHQISWEPDPSPPGKGRIFFEPPINNSPMDFDSKVNILNAMHFNEQDRLAIAEDPLESSYATIQDACELFVFKVKFPESFSPKQPQVRVLNREGERDDRERDYASSRFSSFPDDRTAVLIVDYPLPGYVYEIVWGLPETEVEELQLNNADRLWGDEIRARLLELTLDQPATQRVLESLKTKLDNATANSKPVGARDLEVVLHVYDREKHGLVCVGASAAGPARTQLLNGLIKVGVTAIGQAYRRREHMKWVRGQNRGLDDAEFLDFDPNPPHTCILSIPLHFPLNTGARIGVLTLATRDNIAPMIQLMDRNLTEEKRAAFQVIVGEATSWYANDLMTALQLQTISISAS